MPSSQWSWSWDVPSFSASTRIIVAVSDSTGAVSGTSKLQSITLGTKKTCKAPPDTLDFVWYTSNGNAPSECGTFHVHWQIDSTNNGIVGPAQFVLLAENDAPLQYGARASDGVWDMPVPFKAGTNFVIVAFDNGKAGTGGVGDVYTVAAKKGRCVSSSANAPSVGLVAAKTTAAAPQSLLSTKPTSKGTPALTKSSSGSSSDGSTPAATQSNSYGISNSSLNGAKDTAGLTSHGGAIAGGVLGSLIVAAIIFGVFVCWKGKKVSQGQATAWPTGCVFSWRWEVVEKSAEGRGGTANFAGNDTGKRPRNAFLRAAMRRSSGSAYGSRQDNLSASFNVLNVKRQGHEPNSVANVSPPAFTSAAQQDSRHITKPSLSSRSIYSVVPDDTLFPSPVQRSHEDTSHISKALSVHRLKPPAFAKVVPDSMLFPPPVPSPSSSSSVGTLIGGIGAGVGTYAAMHASAGKTSYSCQPEQDVHDHQQPFGASAGRSPTSGSLGHIQPLSSGVQMPTANASPPSYPEASTAAYVPPPYPASTSIHDPYSHMSQIYTDPAVQAQIASYSSHGLAQVQPPEVSARSDEYKSPPMSAGTSFNLDAGRQDAQHLPFPSASAAAAASLDAMNSKLPSPIYLGSRGRADAPLAPYQSRPEAPRRDREVLTDAPVSAPGSRATVDGVECYGEILPYL